MSPVATAPSRKTILFHIQKRNSAGEISKKIIKWFGFCRDAGARSQCFSWTTPGELDLPRVEYYEDHRMDKAHYLYGVRQTERVMLIEDEISSGKEVSGFCQALRKNGIEVVSIVSFIETINFEGRKLIKDTTGLDLISLTKIQLIG